MRYAAPRGTADVLPEDSLLWQYVENKFRAVCNLYGYEEIRTPTFEETELFTRSMGEHTDVVSKEMYTFTDRSGRSMTLRPEGTAPVVRAYIQGNLFARKPVTKVYYIASIFRYERPQAGRFREHHQVGIEALGSQDPALDVEVINLLMRYLTGLGIRNLELRINSVGCPACRSRYREALTSSLRPHLGALCANCATRLDTNPLRMLDCKISECREINASAPAITEFLCEQCSQHFDGVLSMLHELSIPYVLDNRLVRGFDYYTKTAFEVVSGELGAQNAVGGGGRYDGLVEELGGPPTPAVGFGCGLERTLSVMRTQNIKAPAGGTNSVFVATLGDESKCRAIAVLATLRNAGIRADIDYAGKSLKAQMKSANRQNARLVIIIGGEELTRNSAKLRDMQTKFEREIPLDDLVKSVTSALSD